MPPSQNPPTTETLFAASIHEIKNRFGLLLNGLETLLARLPDDDSGDVDRIRHDAQFIGSELVRVLSLFKSANGRMQAVIDEQYLEDFLEECVARHATTARATGAQIAFECDADLTGFFDASLISIVLDTCVYNGIKAGATRIVLRAETDGHHLQIHVDDNGPGFPEAMLDAQESSVGVNAAAGTTGLGLFFARQILSLHASESSEGRLILERSPDAGARVTLCIPA